MELWDARPQLADLITLDIRKLHGASVDQHLWPALARCARLRELDVLGASVPQQLPPGGLQQLARLTLPSCWGSVLPRGLPRLRSLHLVCNSRLSAGWVAIARVQRPAVAVSGPQLCAAHAGLLSPLLPRGWPTAHANVDANMHVPILPLQGTRTA